jgi:hypothetical protein
MTGTRRRVLESFNAAMDRVPRTDVRLGGWRVPAYGLGVGTGVISSVALVEGLAMAAGLRVAVATAALACGLLTALALASATRAATGEERFTYYHYAVAVVTGVAVMLAAIGVPVLPYLDLMALGLALCLTTGRVGCLMAGCCHGRPSGWGIRYGHLHAREGFSPHLVGVRLLPLQAIEALGIGSITVIGAAMVLRGAPSGSALAWSAVAYGAVRFVLEFLRGDCARPHLAGIPEAQWTAVLMTGAVVWAERSGMLPVEQWHGAIAAALAGVLVLAALFRRFAAASLAFLRADDIRDIAEAVARVAALQHEATRAIPVVVTPAGLRISGGRLFHGTHEICHYTLSAADRPLAAWTARQVAVLIGRVRHPARGRALVGVRPGVFHLLLIDDAGGAA